jgi:hypothetical protein
MDPRILIAVCFALFFVVIFLIQCIPNEDSEKMLPGFWTVSEAFQQKAKIDQMIMYFSEGEGYTYTGYFIMVVDGETTFNGTMIFRITPKGYFKSRDYVFETEKDTGVIPQKMTMSLCPSSGLMELKCLESKKVYARLFKDNQMSAKTVLKIGGHDTVLEDAESIEDDDAEVL